MQVIPVTDVSRGFWLDQPPAMHGGSPRSRLPRSRNVRRLLTVGGVPERPLHVRPVPVAVLRAGAVRLAAGDTEGSRCVFGVKPA